MIKIIDDYQKYSHDYLLELSIKSRRSYMPEYLLMNRRNMVIHCSRKLRSVPN